MRDHNQPGLVNHVFKTVLGVLTQKKDPTTGEKAVFLDYMLRILAKFTSQMLVDDYLEQYGTNVFSGPFKGLNFVDHAAEGCLLPKLLGCYEYDLHPVVEHIIAAPYENIINIGCAEGYYVAGFAKRKPNTQIYGYDTNKKAIDTCISVLQDNNLLHNVTLKAETFQNQDFETFAGQKTLIWCDIEGGEYDLLKTSLSPALKAFDILVEVHPTQKITSIEGINTLSSRFSATHHVQLIKAGTAPLAIQDYPFISQHKDHLKQLICQWEWRSDHTPWLWLKAKN